MPLQRCDGQNLNLPVPGRQVSHIFRHPGVPPPSFPLGLDFLGLRRSGSSSHIKFKVFCNKLLGTAGNEHIDSLFSDDWHERINLSIQDWPHEQNMSLQSLSRTEWQDPVVALEYKGAFHGQAAAKYVARCLGLGRATVY